VRIYSELLARGQLTGPVNVAVYTAPLGSVIVVRDIVLYHDDTVIRTLGIYGLSGGIAAYLVADRIASPKTTVHYDGRQVLIPGEVLYVISDATVNVIYRISGYRFDS